MCEQITSLFFFPTDVIFSFRNFAALAFHTAHKQVQNKTK